MKRPDRYSAIIFTVLLVFLPGKSIPASEVPGWDDLVSVYYRLEVTNYCGITTQKALAGFAVARDDLVRQHQFSPTQIDSIRAEAWTAGYREWDNRGLGGFRGWCKKEGNQYLEYFNSIAIDLNSGG